MRAEPATLNPTWLKASVLGAMWASSEIILGSFFHNLRIPFSSIILTGIGIMLLVSVSHRWKERGLIWRAGLICAVMKSISPSAIIFGPMIAIFFESLLMQISVTMSGRTIPGYLAGGILAMSWNLVQKVVNLLIYYGLDIVGLYSSLIEYANRQLGSFRMSGWTPVLLLLAFYGGFGLLAAAAGVFAGRASTVEVSGVGAATGRSEPLPMHKGKALGQYSYGWLGFTAAGLLAQLTLMNYAGPLVWITAGLMLLSLWVSKYHGVLRPLGKPKFWVIFFVITMLSSLVMVKVRNGMDWTDGLMAGFEMNFRAAVVMVAFSVIGKEMSNPGIRDFFLRTWFRQLPLALEAAFDTLPFAVAGMPPLRTILRHPLQAMRQFGAGADAWLGQIQSGPERKHRVVIILGRQGAGKTTLMEKLAGILKSKGINTYGFVSPVIIENGARKGYLLKDLARGKVMQLSVTEPIAGADRSGSFYFIKETMEYGRSLLEEKMPDRSGIFFIDEIGPLELSGKGWSNGLSFRIRHSGSRMILAVRDRLASEVAEHWNIADPLFIDLNVDSPEDACDSILRFFTL